MERYETIIIGAGANGLACATLLAAAGQRVLVAEAAERAGGLAADREFHPGFRVPIAHSLAAPPDRRLVEALGLADHGYRPAPAERLVGLSEDGQHVIPGPGEPAGIVGADSDALADYYARLQGFADALAPFWLRTMPRIAKPGLADIATWARLGFGLKGLGREELGEFLRIASLPMRDLLDESFANDRLKATLAWPALVGSRFAPRSPNGAVLMLLYRMARAESADGERGEAGTVRAFRQALIGAAEQAGAELRLGAPVTRIRTRGSDRGPVVAGVEIDGGETIDARRVVSSADPKATFFDLVGVDDLDIGFTNRIRRLRTDGLVAKLHLALDQLPEFTGLGEPRGRLIHARDLDHLEFAWDAAKYRELPEDPVMEIMLPSLDDPALASGEGHVLSAQLMYVPGELRGGWSDERRETLQETVIEILAGYAPRIREHIVGSELLTPADVEREYRVTGGHWHHAEFAFDQMLMMRPTYEAAQYRTPVEGLFLCGAGCHPAGDVNGAAGHNAAKEILR